MGTDFRDNLRLIESMTVDDLQESMTQIPEDIRLELAKGPNPNRYACSICLAFGENWYKHVIFDPADPMVRVFFYHEIPKIYMKHADDQWYGPLARQVNKRCVETYEAAGWEKLP